MSGDRNLQVAGMERDWPEGRGIFHNEAKTVLLAVSRLLVTQSRPSLARTSLWMSDMATSTLAPPIEELAVQPRGTRGESGGQTGFTYDISNKHRLGYSEVQLVQVMIDGVNTLYKEDVELQKKHGL